MKIPISPNWKARWGGAPQLGFGGGGQGDGDWEAARLGGWKVTTALKHASATGWERKDAKGLNSRAADPAEDPAQQRVKNNSQDEHQEGKGKYTWFQQGAPFNGRSPGWGEAILTLGTRKLKEKAEHAISEA